MNGKTTIVFNGWLKLTPQEKEEFRKATTDFLEKREFEKRAIMESSNRTAINLGPLSNGCPCCGK